MRQPPVQDPDLKRDALYRGIEQEMPSLMAGIRNLVARSGLATSAAQIESLAEDAFQEVVLKAMEHRDSYDEARPIRPWFMKFALNYLRNLRNSRKRRRGIVTPVAQTGRVQAALAASEGSCADDVSEAEMFDLLARPHGSQPPGDAGWNMLLSLAPEGDREILTLRFRDRLDYEGIGQALKITAGTAGTRLCRALERLRQAYWESERFAGGES